MATLAKEDTSVVEVNPELSLEESKGKLATLSENKSLEDQKRVKELKDQIDMGNTSSIISFAVDIQGGLTEKSNAILSGVRNKDTGPAGEVMNGLMVQIRGLGLDDLTPGEKRGLWAKLLNKLTPVAKFIQQYEGIESQVDSMVNQLETHKRTLERDVIMLDGMYDEALVFFNNLAFYIEAGELKLVDVRSIDIPALEKEVSEADEKSSMIKANELRDLNERANDLERRVHDLMLTRQVTMQMLPQLRMIQDVDKGLVTKIQSSVLTTIPIWKTQIAMAITLWRQAEATKSTKAVTDATNEMLLKNSKLLKDGSGAARREIERGVVDIETIKQVNQDLIATINEAVQIASDGHKARIAAQADMIKCEAELKDALVNSKDSAQEALG